MPNLFSSPTDLILREVSDSIVLQDLSGRVVYANDSAIRFLGFHDFKEIKKENRSLFSNCLFQDQSGHTVSHLPGHSVLLAQKPVEHTFRYTSPEGKKGWVLATALPIRGADGRLKYALNRFQDVSKQREAEDGLLRAKDAADSANRAKTEFVAHVSHEIRTPLSAMIGFTELLLRELPADSAGAAYANIARRNGRQLLRLLDDLLDLSKVESGKLALERIRFSISQILTDVAAIVGPLASEKKVPVEIKLEGLVPEWITSDPTRVRQILVNIVGNAVKFSEKGKVVITVKMESNEKGGSPKLVFLIRDGGSGIAEDLQKKLFQPFSQSDPTVYRKYGGTGLGLQLSRQLAQALGGDVVLVESQLGGGSLFAVTIDPGLTDGLAKAVDFSTNTAVSPDLTEAENKISETNSLEGMRVLLVEDAHDNQILFDRVLKRAGVEVDIADDGEHGIEKALRGEYDLILMDVQMPGIDGYTATHRLRDLGYTRPIVALTAHAMTGEREKSLAAGCDDYISKPVPLASLVERVSRFRGAHLH